MGPHLMAEAPNPRTLVKDSLRSHLHNTIDMLRHLSDPFWRLSSLFGSSTQPSHHGRPLSSITIQPDVISEYTVAEADVEACWNSYSSKTSPNSKPWRLRTQFIPQNGSWNPSFFSSRTHISSVMALCAAVLRTRTLKSLRNSFRSLK